MSETNTRDVSTMLQARLRCVTPPSERQVAQFKEFLSKRYHTASAVSYTHLTLPTNSRV